MNHTIQKNSREAAYVQIARRLRSLLQDGSLLDEQGNLPGYRTLAVQYGVSVCVIQQAMRVLKAESLVQINHGRSSKALPGDKMKTEMMKFALIHPYDSNAGFGRSMSHFMMTAQEKCHCPSMLHVRSSKHNAALEREIAEDLVYNGVDGIVLSPEYSLSNAEYFRKLSETVPVMLVDQYFPEVDLPATIVDFAGGGKEIGRGLRDVNCRKVLALLNDTNNQSIRNIIDSMSECVELTPLYLPIFQGGYEMQRGNFAIADQVNKTLREALIKTECDCLFSPFPRYVDLYYLSAIPAELRKNRRCAVLTNGVPELLSRNYYEEPLLQWEYSYLGVIQGAFERLIKWCGSGRRPHGIQKTKITFSNEIITK